MRSLRYWTFGAVTAAVFCLALFAGPHMINPFDLNGMERDILLSIRMPRVVVALLMGMALGASGAVLQGVLRNPLADPYILGISSGASLAEEPAFRRSYTQYEPARRWSACSWALSAGSGAGCGRNGSFWRESG